MGDLRSRIIHLADGQDRGEARNLRTGVLIGDEPVTPPARFAELFKLAWPDLRRMLASFGQPGIAVVAVDAIRQRVAGTLALALRVGRANAAVIGRHGHCDLYLHADPQLALRHLVLIAHPQAASGEVTYRLLDLRTRTAFADESGKRLEALTASGPTFVKVGSYALFLLPTGPDDVGPWPERADDAWACVPERVYVQEAEAEPDRWARRRSKLTPARSGLAPGTGVDPFGQRESVTLVRTQPGPSRATVTNVEGEEATMGTLTLRAAGRSEAMKVGAAAARTGVLVGRYERCDTHGATVLAHHGISRVHVLIVEIEGALYAIDTGSTNGIYEPRHGDAAVRVAALGGGAELVLGDDLARMEWRPT